MKEFTIPFVGLKEGKHNFEFGVTNAFFDFFGYDEFNDVAITASLLLNKTATMLELDFSVQGTINVNCDLTNEPFDQAIETDLRLLVHFGEEFNNENEEILILPHGEYEVDVKEYIYEMIVLARPFKVSHPGIEDGTLDIAILSSIEEYSLKESTEEESDDVDPRWNKLKNLLTDK